MFVDGLEIKNMVEWFPTDHKCYYEIKTGFTPYGWEKYAECRQCHVWQRVVERCI